MEDGGGEKGTPPIPAFPTGGGRPLDFGTVQYCSKRHADQGHRAVGGSLEPPGVGLWGAMRLGWAGARMRCVREPAGSRWALPAHGACILSDTGCIPVGLAEAEGVVALDFLRQVPRMTGCPIVCRLVLATSVDCR